jgi:transposase
MSTERRFDQPAAIRTQLGAIFVSLELSQSTWLVTSLSPGAGERMSKRGLAAGDVAGLLAYLTELRRRSERRAGVRYPIVTIQEAGLDGFWLHRVLEREGVESHVVDAASIAAARRRRRAKTDRLDGEALLRALMAYKRGEPRVCSMARAPTPEEEDQRRVSRERGVLIAERVRSVNRIKGLLFAQGVRDYRPLRRDRRRALEGLRTGDGRELPAHLKAQIARALDRLEMTLDQIAAVEAERDALLAEAAGPTGEAAQGRPKVGAMLIRLRSIGPEFAAVLSMEGLGRHFANRRQAASYAGLAPTPWRSGAIAREQGVSKAGNPRLRTTMIQLAWLWLRHQPQSALTLWFRRRAAEAASKDRRKTSIVALARKLLVALWKYVADGVAIEGALFKDQAGPA